MWKKTTIDHDLRGGILTIFASDKLTPEEYNDMNSRTKQTENLQNLASEFEGMSDNGTVIALDDKDINKLIDFYKASFQFDKALDVVDYAIDRYHVRLDLMIMKAQLLFEDGSIDDCLNTITLAETTFTSDKDFLPIKIKILSTKKDFEAARECLERLQEISFAEDLVVLYVSEAFICEAEKDYQGMYLALKNALRLDPVNHEAIEKFWNAVELAKKYEDSVNFHKSLIDHNPYNHLAWFNLGLSYSCNWEYEKAISALEYSFIIEPNFESGYLECAELCIQQNKIEKALDIYLEANNRFGPEADLMVSAAECYLKLQDVKNAKILLHKIIKSEPYHEEAYYLLGNCLAASENWYAAINSYFKAIDLDDSREEYFLALAKAYVKVEDFNKATINFHKAAILGNEETVYWKEYTCFMIKLGLYQEALQILDEAEDYTFGADLLYCRAIALFFTKKKRAGLDILAEALEEDFSEHSIIYTLAPELEIDKEINAMIKYYESEFGDI